MKQLHKRQKYTIYEQKSSKSVRINNDNKHLIKDLLWAGDRRRFKGRKYT